jgi:hypothetical protein
MFETKKLHATVRFILATGVAEITGTEFNPPLNLPHCETAITYLKEQGYRNVVTSLALFMAWFEKE